MTITVKELHEKISHAGMEQDIYFRACDESMGGRIVTGHDILVEYEKTFNEVTSDVYSAMTELEDYRDEIHFFEIV